MFNINSVSIRFNPVCDDIISLFNNGDCGILLSNEKSVGSKCVQPIIILSLQLQLLLYSFSKFVSLQISICAIYTLLSKNNHDGNEYDHVFIIG